MSISREERVAYLSLVNEELGVIQIAPRHYAFDDGVSFRIVDESGLLELGRMLDDCNALHSAVLDAARATDVEFDQKTGKAMASGDITKVRLLQAAENRVRETLLERWRATVPTIKMPRGWNPLPVRWDPQGD